MYKKRLFLLGFFIFLISQISAQEDIGLDPFGGLSDLGVVAPPEIPLQNNIEDNGSVENIGEEIYSYLELKDINTGEPINNIHVMIIIEDHLTAEEFKTLKYVGEDGLLSLFLEDGTYTLTLKVDKLDTQGNDYINSFDVEISGRFYDTIYLLPVGSVRGVVYDKNDNAVSSANVQFDCGSNYGETKSTVTDSFGSFSSNWLPIGSCRISSAYDNSVGFELVDVQHGSLEDIEIKLTKSIVTSGNNYWFVIYVILGLLILYGANYVTKNKGKKQRVEKEVKDIEEEKNLSKRSDDVLKTLSDRERDIVHFLLESDNKSTQSKVRYSTGIPKTSLGRILDSLVRKKVISIEKVGKMKKIVLTDWFLGKD